MSARLPLAALFAAALATSSQAQDTELRNCVIQPSAVVDVSVPRAGLVREVMVGRGDAVLRGDTLLRLDDAAIAIEVALAKRRATDRTQLDGLAERISVLEAQIDRARSLFDRNLMAQSELDRTEDQLLALYQQRDRLLAERDLAALELTRVETLLAERVVTSPTEGIVTARNVDPGEYAAEQDPVLTIAALDPLHVELYVPLALRDRIAAGDTVRIAPELESDGTSAELDATVEVVDKVFDAASGTFGVRLTLPNPGLELPAGLRCRARL